MLVPKKDRAKGVGVWEVGGRRCEYKGRGGEGKGADYTVKTPMHMMSLHPTPLYMALFHNVNVSMLRLFIANSRSFIHMLVSKSSNAKGGGVTQKQAQQHEQHRDSIIRILQARLLCDFIDFMGVV